MALDHLVSVCIARALRDGDECYAASTYALCEILVTQREAQVRRDATPPRPFYRHLDDPSCVVTANSLVMDDKGWREIETPDATGFRGLTCSSALLVDRGPECFNEAGFCAFKGGNTADSDVVMFESTPDDEFGIHAPVLTGETYATFPPNTLFRLKRIVAAGAWEAPGGVCPRQRLLVVSATYQRPQPSSLCSDAGGRMCDSVVTLQYGNRHAFVHGLDDILANPAICMEHEFNRDSTWEDWKGVRYNLQTEWAYVNGEASATPGCTPGTRDANNHGKTPEQFCSEVNEFIRQRRSDGLGTALLEKDAFLTLEEVLAIRLYSGPSYQPLNAFLRAVSSLQGRFRTELAAHAGLTFAATVRHIIQGIRKLSAVATAEEASQPLWRGVRGELPDAFWLPDKAGFVVAVDMAFMSTSRSRQTPIDYMSATSSNVLWALKAQPESDAGYHCGADIRTLSQFASEAEVLFPPCTMLAVLSNRGADRAESDSCGVRSIRTISEGDKRFACIDVLPTFV